MNNKERGKYFDDTKQPTRVGLPTRDQIIDEVTQHPRGLHVVARNPITNPEPRTPELVIVDSLRRQIERAITIEPGHDTHVAVILWGDKETTQLGIFTDPVDAALHRQAVIDGILQAARRAAHEDDRRVA